MTSVTQPIDIESFKTKKSLREYTKNAINEIGVCSSLKNKNLMLYNFLLDLFSRHPGYPDKVVNMIDIIIVRNKMNPAFYELQLHRMDNTYEDISWRTCVDGKRKDALTAAMRMSISDQIIHFKKSNELCCEFCKCRDRSSKEFHVDHIITFKDIQKQFLKLYPLIPGSFAKNDYNISCFRSEDAEYERLWQDYHRSNATLRILCAKCNLTRPRNDSDSE